MTTTTTLTDEQQALVDAPVDPGSSVKMIAYAGTGKTSTLEKVAEKYSGDEVLYLAFNKSVEQEAQMRFPCNTTAKTVHALAWQHVGCRYRNITNLYIWQVAKAMAVTTYEAALLQHSLESWLNSADPAIGPEHIEPDRLGKFKPDAYVNGMVHKTEELWHLMQNTAEGINMSHSGYLKLFQLGQPKLDFPIVLLDEAQDTNPVTLALVLKQAEYGSRVYFVGDPYQQIYSWRGAIDAMTKIECPSFRITQSFRFGPEVAKLGSLVLKRMFGETTPLRGTPGIDSRIKPIQGGKHTVLVRTNAGVVLSAYEALNQGAKVHVIGDRAFEETLRILWQLHFLSIGQKDRITERRLAFHRSFGDLKAYAEESLDVELLSKIGIVESFGGTLPSILTRIKEALVGEAVADVVVSTCHKAKGLQWPRVKIGPDFEELYYLQEGPEGGFFPKNVVRRPSQSEEEITAEEVNLLYVALTRVQRELDISTDVKRLFVY